MIFTHACICIYIYLCTHNMCAHLFFYICIYMHAYVCIHVCVELLAIIPSLSLLRRGTNSFLIDCLRIYCILLQVCCFVFFWSHLLLGTTPDVPHASKQRKVAEGSCPAPGGNRPSPGGYISSPLPPPPNSNITI